MALSGAYYNEIDPFAAEWLRELIRDGLIASGEVDERSIADVEPADLAGFAQCHFFAGIGGWSIALRLAGWPDDRPVWTGSCPCQPFSVAGKGAGAKDARHLWPEFFRLIQKCGPSTVFGEQVASKDGRDWLAGVRADLEALDYAVGAADLCAAGVGAPHIRQRLWWVAESASQGPQRAKQSRQRTHAQFQTAERGCGDGRLADAERKQEHQEQQRPATAEGRRCADGSCGCGAHSRLADHDDGGLVGRSSGCSGHCAEYGDSPKCGTCSRLAPAEYEQHEGRVSRPRVVPEAQGVRAPAESSGLCTDGFWSDSIWHPCRDGKLRRIPGKRLDHAESLRRPERQDVAGSEGEGVSQAKQGESACHGCVHGNGSGPEIALESSLFPLAHGVSNRVGILRGAGNAIVPQVAAEFIQAYIEIGTAGGDNDF